MLYSGHSVDYTRLSESIYQCSGHNSFHQTYTLLSESQSSVGVNCELSGSSWNVFYVFYEIFLFLFTDTAQWMCLLWSLCSVSRWCLPTFLDYLYFKTDPQVHLNTRHFSRVLVNLNFTINKSLKKISPEHSTGVWYEGVWQQTFRL